ncbi:hypothetical protein L596_009001 [Steinernema carpocapsae]|uniref:Uncharacterized protein n=1 Tax=Steinernema carpocapsae TaxID=34508 RepID=A0A4U5PEC3_STECR|nr:hypothetical protein L596_009001 [Steinernema carpocapsae]
MPLVTNEELLRITKRKLENIVDNAKKKKYQNVRRLVILKQMMGRLQKFPKEKRLRVVTGEETQEREDENELEEGNPVLEIANETPKKTLFGKIVSYFFSFLWKVN